jgi:predicted aconitase
MRLSTEQQQMLAGEYGAVVERQMRLLVRLGELYQAEHMVNIGSAHISGVSYKSIGDPGLEFLEDIASQGAKVKVVTFVNPCGMDLENWEELGFPKDFAAKQKRIMQAFYAIGVMKAATCTPYLVGNLPRFGEHLAWAESSAVSFANSVIGARTNREGGPSALAAAICGCTAAYGLHLAENRKPQVVVEVNAKLRYNSDFGALGYIVGKLVQNKIPYYTGIGDADSDNLKSLGAAMAASGAVALYHIAGITPEAAAMSTAGLDIVRIGETELRAAYANLNTGKEPDMVMIGCPHASLKEISHIAQTVAGRKLRKPLWICTSRITKDAVTRMGLTAIIEAAGGKIVADTCMVVSPIEEMGVKTIGVDSGKAANYLPGFCKQNVVFTRVDDFLEG